MEINSSTQIQFRASTLASELGERVKSGTGANEIARRDLARYYWILDGLKHLRLSVKQAAVIVDACNGLLCAEPLSIAFLYQEILDSELARKWGFTEDEWNQFARFLADLDRGSLAAIVDAAERFWSSDLDEPTYTLLARVGLVQPLRFNYKSQVGDGEEVIEQKRIAALQKWFTPELLGLPLDFDLSATDPSFWDCLLHVVEEKQTPLSEGSVMHDEWILIVGDMSVLI